MFIININNIIIKSNEPRFFEKPYFAELLINFTIFYGTPNVHYRVHNSPPLVCPEPDQSNPYHSILSL
jgi:hypothetical protein